MENLLIQDIILYSTERNRVLLPYFYSFTFVLLRRTACGLPSWTNETRVFDAVTRHNFNHVPG